MLIVPDAKEAVTWYKKALGATELWNLGSVAGLAIAGAPIFLHEENRHYASEKSPREIGMTSTRIEVFVDDPDRLLARAVAEGATRTSDVVEHEVPWGKHRQGGFCDPFGHIWSVGDMSPLDAHETANSPP